MYSVYSVVKNSGPGIWRRNGLEWKGLWRNIFNYIRIYATKFFQPPARKLAGGHKNHMSFEFSRYPLESFPDVVIHADETEVRSHPAYKAAKTGDSDAAYTLVHAFLHTSFIQNIQNIISKGNTTLVAVHAVEKEGLNAIPEAMADVLSNFLSCEIDIEIVQTNIVSHTKADGFSRIARQPVFNGRVDRGKSYFLVDDFVGMGSTLANLRGWIMRADAHVSGATVLTGKGHSAKLQLNIETIHELREKHGTELETWWNATFGFGYDCLTNAEAGYLLRTPSAERIRNRITEKIQEGDQ